MTSFLQLRFLPLEKGQCHLLGEGVCQCPHRRLEQVWMRQAVCGEPSCRSLLGLVVALGKLVPLFLFFKVLFVCLFVYLERKGKGERKRGRETSTCGCLERPRRGTWSITQACALTGNRTGNPLVHRLAFSPLSYTSQGRCPSFANLLYSRSVAEGCCEA